MHKNEGPRTKSEEYLKYLGEKAFFSMWAYTNLTKIQPKAKELCDMLVVFNNKALIFSIKEPENKQVADDIDNVNWQRWFREYILGNLKQSEGAAKWITNHPDRVSYDVKNEDPFKFDLKDKEIHIFLVSLMSNKNKQISITYTDEKLFNDKGQEVDIISEKPFEIKINKNSKYKIHILDDVNLDIMLKELDTIHDFICFYEAKERLIENNVFLKYNSESDLLPIYFNSETKNNKYNFDKIKNSKVFIEPNEWVRFKESMSYKVREQANSISYKWDDLIENFIQHHLEGGSRNSDNESIYDNNSVAFYMAQEGRLSRRFNLKLIQKDIDFFASIKKEKGDICTHNSIITNTDTGVVYVVLQLNSSGYSDLETYIQARTGFLKIAAVSSINYLSKLESKCDFDKIIGLAFDDASLNTNIYHTGLLVNLDTFPKKDIEKIININKILPKPFWSNMYRKNLVEESEFCYTKTPTK